MSDTYLWLKVLHLFGVIWFMGNIIVTGWWKNMADQTKNPQIIAFAQRQVTLTDWIFTAGGVVILFAAGLANVWLYDMQFSSKWIAWGLAMFTISGLIWATVLIPVQTKQAKMAKDFTVSGVIPDEYWRLCNIWNMYGLLAIIIPLVNLYWMVFKPA
jgi:uncharacterized membrane protein